MSTPDRTTSTPQTLHQHSNLPPTQVSKSSNISWSLESRELHLTSAYRRSMNITVYSELLSNLRKLSIVASLPSPSDSTTSASISEDGSVLTVSHRGDCQLLDLPAIPQRSALAIPRQPSTVLTWRLRLPPSDGAPRRFALEDQAPPWSARDLRVGSPINCRTCGECIVSQGSILEWKDLPSDNWAEMMEFWHCHKPVDHSNPAEEANGDQTTTNKGYGANNVISAQRGVGLVDVTSLVLSTADCSAIIVSHLKRILSTALGGARSWPSRLRQPFFDMVSDTTPPEQVQARSMP